MFGQCTQKAEPIYTKCLPVAKKLIWPDMAGQEKSSPRSDWSQVIQKPGQTSHLVVEPGVYNIETQWMQSSDSFPSSSIKEKCPFTFCRPSILYDKESGL